jgi:DNA-binding transcriptional LysR family regulator
MSSLVDLGGMALFVKIVESGSLSAAGRALSLPKATVSRQLALMESRLRAPLVRRSTRALTLTDMGRHYYERVKPIVRDAELAQIEALAQHASPSGLLRVTAPIAFGQCILAPLIFDFLQAHPAVRIDLRLSDEKMNVVSGAYDLALRMGRLDDSELASRRIDVVEYVLAASPAYLKQNGMPETIQDLTHTRAILTRPDLDHWTIGGTTVRLIWCISTGNMMLTCEAACAGLGIAMMPTFVAQDALAAGKLVQLFPDQPIPSLEVTALYPRAVVPSVALSTFLAFVTSKSHRGKRRQKSARP